MDDEEARPKRGGEAVLGQELRTLSVEELRAYAAALDAERKRVEAEIAKRQDVRGAAEALFKPRP